MSKKANEGEAEHVVESEKEEVRVDVALVEVRLRGIGPEWKETEVTEEPAHLVKAEDERERLPLVIALDDED